MDEKKEQNMIEAGAWYLRSLDRSAVSISAHMALCLQHWPDLDPADLHAYLLSLMLWSVSDDEGYGTGGPPSPREQAIIDRVADRMRARIRRRLQRAA